MDLFGEHWPWWLGAASLATVSFGFLFAARGGLGVSGSFARVLFLGESREREEAERAMPDDAAALEAALVAATLAEFGDATAASDDASDAGDAAPLEPPRRRAPASAHAIFLVSMLAGGCVAALAAGTFELRWSLGADFDGTFGTGPLAWATLLLGGTLVGFGTAMAGGCTSGHGLSGCSRLQAGSLASTAIFFGTGILVSMLLEVFA